MTSSHLRGPVDLLGLNDSLYIPLWEVTGRTFNEVHPQFPNNDANGTPWFARFKFNDTTSTYMVNVALCMMNLRHFCTGMALTGPRIEVVRVGARGQPIDNYGYPRYGLGTTYYKNFDDQREMPIAQMFTPSAEYCPNLNTILDQRAISRERAELYALEMLGRTVSAAAMRNGRRVAMMGYRARHGTMSKLLALLQQGYSGTIYTPHCCVGIMSLFSEPNMDQCYVDHFKLRGGAPDDLFVGRSGEDNNIGVGGAIIDLNGHDMHGDTTTLLHPHIVSVLRTREYRSMLPHTVNWGHD